MSLSADGKWLATGVQQEEAFLWDVAKVKQIRTFHEHKTHQKVQAGIKVALSGDAKLLVTGSPSDDLAMLWDTVNEKRLQTFKGHQGIISGVAISNDKKIVLTGSHDNQAIVWNAADGNQLQHYKHSDKIHSVALAGDGKTFVIGTHHTKNAILLRSSPTEPIKKLQTFEGHKGDVFGVGISEDGQHVFTGSYDGTACMWEAASGKKLHTYAAPAK